MRWMVPVLLAMCAASSLFLFAAHSAMRRGECPEVPFPAWEPAQEKRRFPRANATALSACAEAPPARTRFAVVAYLAGGSPGGYAEGAVVLARTLARFTDLDRVLLTTDSIPAPPEGWTVCTVPAIPNLPSQPTNRFTDARVYSKFNAWRLVEYEAILLLDLDTLVVADPTDAFTVELPAMGNATLGAALDRPAPGCARCEPQAAGAFNSGVLLVVPTLDGFRRLLASIPTVPHDATYQSLLNAVYAAEFHELPFAYNANLVSVYCEPDLWTGDVIRILHFTVAKPWAGSVLSLSSDNPLACAWNGVRPYCDLWRLVREPRPRCMWRSLAPGPV